jgi:DNA-binding NarL/FixJ family response regulator
MTPIRRPEEPPLFPPALWRQLARHLGLTKRQLLVAQMICAECTVPDIARRMERSPSTIASHVRRLYRRLGVRTRVGVVVRLVEHARSIE